MEGQKTISNLIHTQNERNGPPNASQDLSLAIKLVKPVLKGILMKI